MSLNLYIVEDEISIIKWMIKNIEWEVYNCKIAGYSTNAVDALSYINEHPIDLLLTDISMPDVSGLELIKSVKERFPWILIIVISAYDKFFYVREAFQYGIISYCLKPINTNEQLGGPLHPRVKDILKEINMHYADNTLSLKKIASSQGMSPVYLGIIFKEQVGELFNEYLQKVRLEKVLELLSNSKISIGEIAISVGFTNSSYLNRVFRKKYGMSPMEYRRNSCKEEVK